MEVKVNLRSIKGGITARDVALFLFLVLIVETLVLCYIYIDFKECTENPFIYGSIVLSNFYEPEQLFGSVHIIDHKRNTINYYLNSTDIHLPVLLILMLIVGAFLGIMAMLPNIVKIKQSNRRLKSKIKQIEQEVKNLRAIPIKDSH